MHMSRQQKRRAKALLQRIIVIIFATILTLLAILVIASCTDQDSDSETQVTDSIPEPVTEIEIISIFSGSKPDEDAKFLQVIGDGKGLPTIQNVDVAWKYMYNNFHTPGYVSDDGEHEIYVDDVSSYITTKLGGNPEKVFSKGQKGNSEIATLSIYVERTVAEKIAVEVFWQNYNRLFGDTKMQLCRNQKLAIAEMLWLGAWHAGLTDTWEKAEKLYEVGSEEFYIFIWDEFWFSLVKEGTETGSAKAADATFELFCNGKVPNTSSELYNNTAMKYYTSEQLLTVGASSLKPGR